MSVKKWAGVLVGVGIVVALGLELWTFSEMFWRGLSGNSPTSNRPQTQTQPTDRFSYGDLQGHFKILYLRANGDDWRFHCVLETTNPSDNNIHLTVTGLRLQTGETISLTEPMILEPGVTRTIQFSQPIPAGTTPEAVKIDLPDTTEDHSRWFQLPKVPVRSG